MPHVIKSAFRSLFIVAVTGIVVAQDGEFYPGNRVIVDGIPKIPVSLAKTVANYRNSLGGYVHPECTSRSLERGSALLPSCLVW